jgi:protoheme IX farnesyltransferase
LLRNFYSLTKPGIVFGNLITVIGGFLLASRGHPNFLQFCFTIIGISLIVASGCVFNNIIDRDIDKIMERTKYRVLPLNLITIKQAIIFAIILLILGANVLYIKVNPLTCLFSLFGFFIYIVAYSLWFKRHSVYGTIIGSVAGAMPPVAGFSAVTGKFELGALLLFLIMLFWQIAHSYAIAIYRLTDYHKAHIPVLPVKYGVARTRIAIVIYISVFIISTLSLYIFGYANYGYLVVVVLAGLLWLLIGLLGLFKHQNDMLWAKQIFAFSIVIILITFVAMSIDYI